MALRIVRTEEDPILRRKSKEVKEINDNIKVLLDDMMETMVESDGVGIAAVQVGVLKRVIIISVESDDEESEEFETIEMIIVSRIKVPKAKPSLAFTPKDDSAFIVIITYLKFKIHTN